MAVTTSLTVTPNASFTILMSVRATSVKATDRRAVMVALNKVRGAVNGMAPDGAPSFCRPRLHSVVARCSAVAGTSRASSRGSPSLEMRLRPSNSRELGGEAMRQAPSGGAGAGGSGLEVEEVTHHAGPRDAVDGGVMHLHEDGDAPVGHSFDYPDLP